MKQSDPKAALNGAVHGTKFWKGDISSGVEWELHRGDARAVLAKLEADRFKCVVTSPPYYAQRDYEVEGQIGLEKTIAQYVKRVVDTFEQVTSRRNSK